MLLFNHLSSLGARFVLILVLVAGLFVMVPVTAVRAATITVPDNYRTIQAAINAASPGDTILVRAGTYPERLILNKSVILTAASFDPSNPTLNTTIIDGGSSRSATISISGGLSPMPTIRGFVIRNGDDGIIVKSDAIIEYNYFIASRDQLDYRAGGGGVAHHNVFFNSGDDAVDLDNMNRSLLIENNRMMYNHDDGIEVRLQDATAPAQPVTVTIRSNEIIGCSEDGIQFIDYGQTADTQRIYFITGNLIANCRFAGIGLMGNANTVEDYSGADIIEAIRVYNNTIYGNNYGISGGDNLIAYNNIIANSMTRGVWRVQGPASLVAYTLLYNNGVDAEQSTLGGFNRFGQNPLFAYAPTAGPDGVWETVDDDFRGLALLAGSPAIDVAYNATCPATDLHGATRPYGAYCDMGAFEYNGTVPTPPPDPITPPVATSLISPSGNITGARPIFRWNMVLDSAQGDAATWFLLRVKKADNTVVINQWYQASNHCTASLCAVQHPTALTGGIYTWDVQTWNDGGYGPWSSSMSFTLPFLPGAASLIAPSGAITDTTPTFSWNVSPNTTTTDPATWYYLWVSRVNPDGTLTTVHNTWYLANAVCGSATCSFTPAATLPSGNYRWWIQTWNNAGYGPWSSGRDFTVGP